MKFKIKKIFQYFSFKKRVTYGLVMVFSVLLAGIALANPPGSPYAPGATLAPTCAPGSLNCTVTTPFVESGSDEGNAIFLEGPTIDSFEIKLTGADPTADRTVTFKDESGTVALLSDILASNALSSITAATTSNTINNGDNPQNWNWSLTTADNAGISFAENTASTATGLSAIVKASTMATSTAMPLYVSNLGSGNSFRVDDQSADTTPFLINDTGQVAIGTDVFGTDKLKVEAGSGISNAISAFGDINNAMNIQVTNRNAGTDALSLFAAVNDGTAAVITGVSSSGYSNPFLPILAANDSLLAGLGGKLVIGTLLPTDGGISFVTQGGALSNERMTITGPGDVGIHTNTPGSALDVKGELRLSGATSGYVGLTVPAVAGGTTYTLPSADGASGDALTTDGAGVLSWVTPTGVWQRVGTTLSPTTAGDDVTTSGNIYTTGSGAITSAGLLTGNLGATVSGADISLNDNSNFNTTINTGTSTGSVTIGSSLAGAISLTSGSGLTFIGGAASSFNTTAGNINLQPAGVGTTANVQIGAGGIGSTTPDLFALDVKSDAGDPAGFNGATYYNASSNEFRCYVNGSWSNCDTTGGTATLQSAYNAGATITTAGATDIALTLTSGNFTASGAGSVNLTPTSASSFTSGGALTFTGGATSTWGTSAGDLILQPEAAGVGSIKIGAGGAGSATPNLFAIDVKSSTGDPAYGFNGAMYYNTFDNDFRCYVAGGWQSCGATAASSTTLQQAYVAGNTITTSAADGDFNVSGTEAVNLTPTASSQFTSGGALTFTGGAASTWSTSAGDLTIDSAAALNLGTTNATSVSVGSAGVTTTNNGSLTSTQTLTASNGLTQTTGALNLTATSGALALSGLSSSSISTGAANSLSLVGDPININSTGAGSTNIGNATGTTALTGSVNLPGLTASKAVFTDGSKNLTSTGTVAILQGGTGQTTKAAAFDALSPLTTKGDLLVYNGVGVNNTRLPASGTNGFVLTADSTQATGMKWASFASSLTDALDFTEFTDAMTLDASTNINLNTFTLSTSGTGSVNLATSGASSFTSSGGALTLTGGAASTWSTSSGALSIDSASALNLGNTNATSVSIGNAGSTFALTSSGGLNASTGGALTGVASLDTIATSATALIFAGAGSVSSTTSSAITLDSGTTGAVNVGTGANAKTITIGNTTGATSLNLKAGTGNILLAGQATGTSATYLGLPVKTDAGDPTTTQINGAMYYNSNSNKFRCYENSAWVDCIPAGSAGDITDVGDVTSGAAFNGTQGNALQFEGATADANEITLTAADPGADFTITLPAATGTVALTSNKLSVFAATTSAELAGVISDETGTGSLVFATSPTLVTPNLGTPSTLIGTNITGTAAGLTAGNVTTNANLTGAVTSIGNATSLGSFTSANLSGALTDETGSGAAVFATSPTLVTPNLGTPSALTLTNATGLPITGITSSTSAQLATLLSDETGTGLAVFNTSPTLVTPALGTPSSGVLTNATGLPLTTGVTGTLPIANGGTNNTAAYTAGSVIFSDGTKLTEDNTNFFFDDTNNRLGLGTATPAVKLQLIEGGTPAALIAGTVASFASGATAATNSYVNVQSGTTGLAAVTFGSTANDDAAYIGYNNNTTNLFLLNGASNANLSSAGLFTTPSLSVTGTSALNGNVTIANGINVVLNTATGTKFGTATTQKMGFFNATPVAQQSGDVATALTNLGLVASPTITATTNANLTGAVTSIGNATSLGSFTSANLSGALTDETGTGVAVFATSPTLVTPVLGVATATSLDSGSGTIQTTGSVFGNNFDRSTAGALTFGNTNATSASICNSAACDTITIGTNADADTITIGDTLDAFSIASTGLNLTTGGALTGVASVDTIAHSATAITFAAAGTISSTTSSAITLDSGTTGIVNLGTGSNAKTINVGTGTAGDIINIATNNTTADTVNIGSALDTVAINLTTFTMNGSTGVSTTTCGANAYRDATGYTKGILTAAGSCVTPLLSDLRLKKNISPLDDNILNNIKLVNTVNFDFRCDDPAFADAGMDCKTPGKRVGVIAQELAQVFPELVFMDENGYYEVNYPGLGIYTLKVVQGQQLLLGDISTTAGLSTLIADVQAEAAHNPITVIGDKVSSGTKILTDFVVARVTAIRGYFDEVFTNTSHQKTLCVGDVGDETCITKTQLDSLLAGAGGGVPSGTGSGSSGTGGSGSTTDTIAPVIALNGDASISLNVGDTYNELGATATDNVDTSVAVIISGSVDTGAAGTYTITYNAKDTAGNNATEATRTVTVGTATPPPPSDPAPDSTPPPVTP